MSETMSEMIGGYRLLRLLGRGGMGTVYEAEGGNGRYVAIKVFSLDHGNVGLLRKRFLAEIGILRKLEDVAVDAGVRFARIRDAGIDESGRPWFAMDLVLNAEGKPETLEDARRKGGIGEAQLFRWFAELAASLEALHAKGIVHRDFKLENVLVDAGGHAVLTDFGVSRILDDGLRRELDLSQTFVTGETTGTRPVMGSYWYLSPDVRSGGVATESSDWYALGVAFFRLLTGIWYEPRSRALDLLAPFPQFWRDQLPRLLDGTRPEPTRRAFRLNWLVVGGAMALLAAAAGGAWWCRMRTSDDIRMLECGGYSLSETPVTRAQWRSVMGGSAPAPGTARWPMTNVTWEEATNFCARLSAQRGRTFRLPTAVEWTKAYRMGKTAPSVTPDRTMDRTLRAQVSAVGWFGQGDDGSVRHADRNDWFAKRGEPVPRLVEVDPTFPSRTVNPGRHVWQRNSAGAPMPVALKPANALGLYDMAGNVFEMVADRFRPDVPHSWIDTEYGFRLGGDVRPDMLTASAGAFPVMFGQPFTPGLSGDEPWGAYFPKMPNLGFRLAADAR